MGLGCPNKNLRIDHVLMLSFFQLVLRSALSELPLLHERAKADHILSNSTILTGRAKTVGTSGRRAETLGDPQSLRKREI